MSISWFLEREGSKKHGQGGQEGGAFPQEDLSTAIFLGALEADLGAVPADEFRQNEVKAAFSHRIGMICLH